MNNRITIPSDLTSSIIESLFVKLNMAPREVDLELPLNIDYTGFGHFPSLLLVLFTWMRHKKGKIIIPIDVNDHKSLQSFATNYYGYIFLSTIWKDHDIINYSDVSLKKAFKIYTKMMHKSISNLDYNLPNSTLAIPTFDHYSNAKGKSNWYYTSNFSFIETSSSFKDSLYRIFDFLSKIYRTKIRENAADILDPLTKIIWELLKNTHEHAQMDYTNESKLTPNCRGLYISIYRSSQRNFISNTKNEGLKAYYRKAFPPNDQLFMLEVSVFDSGPGLVKRFLGKSWSEKTDIQTDIDTIKKCLIKGQTSVSNVDGINKGYGLDDVLRLLDLKSGFLKIRTGRVSIYRDLILSPYKRTDDLHKVDLFDWSKYTKNDYSKMANAEGTAITLVYPLNYGL